MRALHAGLAIASLAAFWQVSVRLFAPPPHLLPAPAAVVSALAERPGFFLEHSLVTLAEPVTFGHSKNDPVRLVVGLAAPDEDGHVTALSTLAEFLSDEARQQQLLSADTADDVAGMVRAFERVEQS